MRRLSDSVFESRRNRILSFVKALPEASATIGGGRHYSFKVRGKTFGYFLDDHHGDGRVAINCKTAPGVNDTLLRVASDRFFVPKYVGARGWLGLWLDLPKIDWAQVKDVITEAYCLVAPRRLSAPVSKDLTKHWRQSLPDEKFSFDD
jgi:predicted DNA-binding protein (MmcQ/YjbR family)